MTDTVATALIVATPPTIAAVGALVVTLRTKAKVQETHLLINSNLDEWKRLATQKYFADGVKAEKENQGAAPSPLGPQ